jgi:glycosyltransferase involved in cell wall biosynthesis/predicted GH43/DUF377 family glycosyl hydrolase
MTPGRRKTIALCMMVRNEEPILERCLSSVRPLIDSWVVCDTGSTDKTPEVVARALKGLPGELHRTSWVDFGSNRSELMELARGAADYLLLIDADMTVRSQGPLPALSADAYLLRETGGLDFGVLRMVRGDRHWWYEGSTHEHIATDGRYSQEVLDELLIEHHADGSARRDKLLRDAGLLKRDIRRDPSNPRPVFYLAQTYRDLGRVDLAIEHYRRRVEMGGWDEEVFYSALQQGALTAQEDLDAAIPLLLRAWERRPSRAEPLYELARAHRVRADYQLAELFSARGLAIPYPRDVLFIHRWVYDWGLALEHALALQGLGRARDARTELRRLLRDGNLPAELALSLAELAPLTSSGRRATGRHAPRRLAELAPSARIGEIQIDVRPRWPPFNPSIAADGDGFRMIVRTANYAIERGVLHEEGVQQNLNYVLHLDDQLSVSSIEPLVDASLRARRFPSRVRGPEDCRLFELGGRWHATATVCDLNPDERREIGLLELDGATIADTTVLRGPGALRHEKNWMPFVVDGEMLLVYGCGPTVVLRCDPATKETTEVARHAAPAWASGLRGGSQGVSVGDGHLFVAHDVTTDSDALRYVHRFILLDDEHRLTAASRPFSFAADRVEFCAGMAPYGDELVLSFGVSDAAAGLAVVGRDEVLALLETVVAKTSRRT